MASAGYIHDQRCPTHPTHGNARVMDSGMYCGHSEHWPNDPKLWTKDRWTFDEWEAAKNGTPEPKSQPTRKTTRTDVIAIKVSKTSARSKNRRRSR